MNRRRWKTDFSTAASKADSAFNKIDTTIAECYKQAEINSTALKMLLEAQMIDHLILKQDVEDRKNLLMLGVKNQPVWQDGEPPEARLKSADKLPTVNKQMHSTAGQFDTKRFAASRLKQRDASNDITHAKK